MTEGGQATDVESVLAVGEPERFPFDQTLATMANDSPKSAASPSPAPEKLEVPTVPPPSSRFVLPPPPSDLMNRLAAFLPQIRTANEMLAQGDRMEGEEEGVTLEEMSSSDEDSSDEDSSSEESDEEVEEGGETDAAAPLAHLLDISARPKVTKKKLEGNPEAVVEGGAGGEKRAVGIVEME